MHSILIYSLFKFNSKSVQDYIFEFMQKQESRGRKNWKKLKQMVLSGNISLAKKKKMLSLFQTNTQYHQDCILTQYQHMHHRIYQRSPLPLSKQLMHFKGDVDATGKWVWESEEIAAFYFLEESAEILKNIDIGKETIKILELGAGSSGIASIALAKAIINITKEYKLFLKLTDGEETNIPFLQTNLQVNLGQLCEYSAQKMLWGCQQSVNNNQKPPQNHIYYDFIIICDCLFFTNFHKQLLQSIQYNLSDLGTVYLINPSRGGSMQHFLQLVTERGFQYIFDKFINEKYQKSLKQAMQSKQFEDDRHFIHFVKFSRKKQ